MNPDHLLHFGLARPPFSKELDDENLWLPPSKKALVERLEEAVLGRHSVVLTGDPGVGKTCVLRAVRERLSTADVRLTYCHNATLGRRDFYRQLCLALGLTPRATAGSLFWAVSTHIEELTKDRVHPVFLLDEAHLLHQDTLDHLHILLNYRWDSQALLSLVLVGLPELEDRLRLRRNRSLYSRIHCRHAIDSLTPVDTAAYVTSRLAHAGAKGPLFTTDALAMLHEATLGCMREIDRIATDCMREAARQRRPLVERETLTTHLSARKEVFG